MAAKSSELDDQMSGANLQTEDHTPIPSRGQKDLEETGACRAVPPPTHHLGLWWGSHFLVALISRHCLGNTCDINSKRQEPAPPPPHTWTAPVVEDMLHHGRTGLTKAIATGPGRAVLFYGRQSLGEGLSLGEVRETAFTLTGPGILVGKLSISCHWPFDHTRRSDEQLPKPSQNTR